MFEKMRSDLVKRLGTLIDRFLAIQKRAHSELADARLAARLGLSANDAVSIYSEIALKAEEQAGVCGEAITEMLVNRALPLIFKRSVGKAENFADQCESVLDEMELAKSAVKMAFKDRFGGEEISTAADKEGEKPLTREQAIEVANLGDQLAELELEMMMEARKQSLRDQGKL